MPLLATPAQAVEFPPRRDGTMRKRQAFGPDRARELNPFLSLTEDWMRAPGGYTEHVHRGYETVTLVLEGQLACDDALGRQVVLGPGDAQWATTGHGLSHRELPHGEGETHLLQLWLNLPAAEKRRAASSLELRAVDLPTRVGPGWEARILAGELDGGVGLARALHPVRLLELRLEAGASLELPVPPAQRGVLYLASGELVAAAHVLRNGGLVHLASAGEETLALAAVSAAHLLVMTASPLAEPVEVSGPFILNTKAEVKQAYQDFKAGFFERPG